MILMETHDNIPLAEAGTLVQRCLNEGALFVVVTSNVDGCTCTVSIQR